MRTRTLLALLLTSMAGTTMAQQTESHLIGPGKRGRFDGTSHIEVDLGQKNALVVGFKTYDQLKARQNVDSVLRLFVADYKRIADTTQNPLNATHVLFRLGDISRTLDVRQTPQARTSFRFMAQKPDPVLVKTAQDTVQVVWAADKAKPYASLREGLTIYILVNSLEDIERQMQDGGINGKLQEAMKAVQQYKGHDLTNPKMAFDLRYKREGNSIQTNFISPGLAKSPFISFQPNIGVGLIRNQWVPSANLEIQFIPSRFKSVGYTIGYLSNFMFQNPTDGRGLVQRNDFVTLGVAFYMNNPKTQKPSFDRLGYSLSIGFLAHRSGDYFAKNTIRLSSTIYQKGFIKIQPELYMNGFFKQVYPGVRIGFGL